MEATGPGIERASEVARCAVHADQPATSACTRCGNFACHACLGDGGGPGFGRCAACREREGVGRMPWEGEGSILQRYGGTCRVAITEPRVTFGGMRSASPGSAVRFALISSVLGFAPLLLLVPLVLLYIASRATDSGAPDAMGMLAIPCAIAFYPAMSFLYFSSIGVMFHGLARLAGGRGSFADSMRAGWYSSAWEPISALSMALYCIPLLGLLVVVGASGASAIWRTIGLRAFAERRHGLSPGRALAVSVLTAGFWLTCSITGFALVVGFALYQRMSLR